jgi:hypothetical protein
VVILPAAQSLFGFGYALFGPNDPVMIGLFSGSTSVGSLSFTGLAADPNGAGGFAGVLSTIPFDRAIVTFSQSNIAYAVDNIRFSPAAVPEPSSLTLLSPGALCAAVIVAWQRRRPPIAA